MRRSHLLILTAVALTITLSLLPLRSAQAGATVQGGWKCRLRATDSGLGVTLNTTQSHAVDTPSGNSVIVCHFEGPVEDLKQAMHSSGFLCSTFSGESNNSKVVITPSGQVLFICRVHHHQPTTTVAGGMPPTTTDSVSGADSDAGVVSTDTSGPVDGGTSPDQPPPADDVPPPPTDGDTGGDEPTPTVPDDGGNCGNDKNVGNGKGNGCGKP